ncbi:MAG: N-acetyl-gamma-glutamyl-phosphate reductase [Phycisphaeraceae bacterium]|nr:N-acetyl-gamma-glutamyl-phosphate reductase [Phycisphaeraceae bacterium]
MPTPTKVAIIGAAGYSGGELISILLNHPHAEIVGLFGSGRSDKPTNIADLHPHLRSRIDLDVRPAELNALKETNADAVFLATPHEASIHWVQDLRSLPRAPKLLDLSGAFRLPASLYPKFYGFEHEHPDLLKLAVYGLPELNRAKIKTASLIAVPGCYPTSAILPIAPLARAGAVRTGTRIIIDSTSGVSGAGRSPTTKSLFCEVSLQPYNVLKHRHNPEINIHSGANTLFTPHLGPYARGILSTIHIDLSEGTGGWPTHRIAETLAAAYANEPFIRLYNSERQGWPSIAAVERTNFCDIAFALDEQHRHLIVVSAIDNLVKGAAGQAVQCFNLLFNYPETTALLSRFPSPREVAGVTE